QSTACNCYEASNKAPRVAPCGRKYGESADAVYTHPANRRLGAQCGRRYRCTAGAMASRTDSDAMPADASTGTLWVPPWQTN
nr:hypothetical protein [Tanacetum cinerariifolium]